MQQSETIALQIAALSELYPKETISELAARLMLSPIFIINALEAGEELGFFNRVKDKKGKLTDKLKLSKPLDYDDFVGDEFGPEIDRIGMEIIKVVTSANDDEMDVEEGTLNYWCRGINPASVELAIQMLTKLQIIGSYELADPKDPKSVYTFYSMALNKFNKWGKKQFKNEGN